jgi:hypothetical protein
MILIHWGIWPRDEEEKRDRTHIAPCLRGGSLMDGHELTEQCPCQPAINEDGFVVHEVIQ